MMKLNTPKRMTLPNGRTFAWRYKRVSRDQLPANVTIRRRYTQRDAPKNKRRRRRGQQRCRGLFGFVKKVIKNPAVKALGQQAIQHLPGLYNAAASRIKNDEIRRALQSDTAKHLLNSATNRLRQMAGISNVSIEKSFENENEEIKKNFIGVYSSNSVTRYISYYKIIKEKHCCYLFAIFSTDRIN